MTCRGHVRAATRPVPQHRSIPFKSTTPETPFDTYVSIRCFVFLYPESLAAQRRQFSYHCSMFYGFVKESVRSPSIGGTEFELAEANSLVIGVSFGS